MTGEIPPAFPLPMAGLDTCDKCKYWCERMKSEMVMTAQGPIPVTVFRSQGQMATGPKGIYAPCTFFPNWQPTPANWWCGQWKAAEKA